MLALLAHGNTPDDLPPADSYPPVSLDRRALAPETGWLPIRELTGTEAEVQCWFLGAHGGAGESTLARLFARFAPAGHAWPLAPHGWPPPRVVLCARTNFWGMRAAQAAMRDWSANYRRHVEVLGLVLVADRPGRLPRSLSDFQRDLEGAAANVWRLPWVDRWSLGEIPSRENAPTREVEALGLDLTAALRARHERQVTERWS